MSGASLGSSTATQGLANVAAQSLANQQYPADSGEYAKMVAKHEAEREAERSKLVRASALEASLRCSHPGSVPSEVIRVAREFEAYLTGAEDGTFKRYSGHDELSISPADTTAKLP